MLHTRRLRFVLGAAIAGMLALPGSAGAQAGMEPVNDRPNPYDTIEGWAKLPEGRTWGSTSAVDIAPDGTIWVAERCGTNSCLDSDLRPVLHFDTQGNLMARFGSGLIASPHGIFVDSDGNVWITDWMDNAPRARRPQDPEAARAARPSRATSISPRTSSWRPTAASSWPTVTAPGTRAS